MSKDQKRLIDAYHKLRHESRGLHRDGALFEGKHWSPSGDMMVRIDRLTGMELRVYWMDGYVEACISYPDGVSSKTYA